MAISVFRLVPDGHFCRDPWAGSYGVRDDSSLRGAQPCTPHSATPVPSCHTPLRVPPGPPTPLRPCTSHTHMQPGKPEPPLGPLRETSPNPGPALAEETLPHPHGPEPALTAPSCPSAHSVAALLLPDWHLRPHRQWEVLLLSRLLPHGGHVRRWVV